MKTAIEVLCEKVEGIEKEIETFKDDVVRVQQNLIILQSNSITPAEIEKLNNRITKFHDDACHDYEDCVDKIETLIANHSRLMMIDWPAFTLRIAALIFCLAFWWVVIRWVF